MSQGRTPARWVGITFLMLLLLCVPGAVASWGVAIQLRSDPDRLPADGRSQAVIVAEVTDATGVPVPDGTVVRFITTAGRIVSPVQTLGGLAQTALTSSRSAASGHHLGPGRRRPRGLERGIHGPPRAAAWPGPGPSR